MAGERVEELDRYKGFLIFLVVLGHFLLPVKDSGMALFSRSFYGIYSFHMPAFIFLSGYFFQQSFVKRGRKASSLFSNLLYYFICYFFLKTLLYPFDVFCYGGQGSFPDYLHESSTPWYLLGLFFWQLACLPLCFFKRNRVYIGKGGKPEDIWIKIGDLWISWPWIGSLVLLLFSISGCSFPNPHFPGRKEETALLSLGEFPCFFSSCFSPV